MHRYIFYTEHNRPTAIDAFYHLLTPTEIGGTPVNENLVKLLPKDDPLLKLIEEDARQMELMKMRSRFALSKGPHMVIVDYDKYKLEDLEEHLKVCERVGTLKDFLKKARV